MGTFSSYQSPIRCNFFPKRFVAVNSGTRKSHSHECPETLFVEIMPKSRREKIVSLTQTDKKGREGKENLFRSIRESLDEHKYAWVFSVENMRNTYLKDVRAQWSDSRIFLGRTKVMAKAIGTSPSEEYQDNIHRLSKLLKGTVGLLCTSHPPELVETWFADYSKTDFARAGTISPVTFTVPAGSVYTRGGQIPAEDDVLLSHTLEPSVRGMGSESPPHTAFFTKQLTSI